MMYRSVGGASALTYFNLVILALITTGRPIFFIIFYADILESRVGDIKLI